MEVDFDKEIDAILRRTRPGTPVSSGDVASPHLNADELSAFAENAMPESAKRLYTVHLAECDRCRKILSDTISLNAEAEPAAASAAAPAVVGSDVPWYRRLFLFPNLAYVMGTLVLVFSGFLGYMVLQNSGGGGMSAVDISQVPESQTGARGGPNFEEPMYPAASNAAANTAVSTANSNAANAVPVQRSVEEDSNAAGGGGKDELAAVGKTQPANEAAVTMDGVTAAPPPPAAVPMTAPQQKAAEAEAQADKDDAAKAKEEVLAEDRKVLSQRSISELPRAAARGPAKKSAGPARDQQNQFPNRAENQYEAVVTRAVGGKKFEQKEGVWYDTAYRGQATTNVRRGTDAFKNLDSGLRSIANSLTGTVVVVWSGKAYRVQ